jgi:hypothetical protein
MRFMVYGKEIGDWGSEIRNEGLGKDKKNVIRPTYLVLIAKTNS